MKNKLLSCCIAAAAALFVALSASWSPARADLYVIESTAAGIAVGARLRPADTISIPSGAHIRAVLPSGKTQMIKGPYNGSVDDLAKGQAQNEGVMAWLRNILQTGGARETTPGATRAIGRESPPPLRVGFSWTTVPATINGTTCVLKGAKLQVARAPSAQAERVTIIDVAKSIQAEVQWSAGNDVAAWPQTLSPRSGTPYYVVPEKGSRTHVLLQVLDKPPADDDVLTELQKHGCRYQFESWVREKVSAAKDR